VNKDAKMLFISLGLFFIACILLVFNSQRECTTIKYQDLQGTHSKYECHDKKPATCWDKYATEALAIQMCEGK
jgi:hypothetical protein